MAQIAQRPAERPSKRARPAAPALGSSSVSNHDFERVVLPFLYPSERGVYDVKMEETSALRKSLSGGNKRLESAVRMNGSNRHNLTYGEILPRSFAEDVMPLLGSLGPEDSVIDLGSGTGKLCLQLALGTGAGRVRGIEFAARRCDVADIAIDAMRGVTAEDLLAASSGWRRPPAAQALFSAGEDSEEPEVDSGSASRPGLAGGAGAALEAQTWSTTYATAVAASLQAAAGRTSLERGCFLQADLSDVTVAFVNNTVFEPDLMTALLGALVDGCPRLRRIVCLRKLCSRHSRRCELAGSACSAFRHPPHQGVLRPTWCAETTVFAYDVVPGSVGHGLGAKLSAATPAAAEASAAAGSPPRTPRKRARDEPCVTPGTV